ncbi:hypothetical protein BUALT_Bualt02G0102300 [Buddleja alternifolia]|uniref:Protein kinase domain-containing protein n=1 Tax=Buddleja alternifolia TaxID=168488 RepID=A0AAV6Y175_9LAMI|nr:hypothetical protein BUALT_Bualt02G0102300 [Buddleja alternifolia]
MVGKKENLVQERGVNEYGDGVSWYRGSMIGKGGFGCVYLATLKNPRSKYSYFPSLMAVKSAEVSVSGSIQKEREVLGNVEGCPDIIKCFGEETTMGENGAMVYNLLLEYGSGGTLADRINKSGGDGLPEFEAKMFARSILRGLYHVHSLGYVHCDLKPENILLVPNSKGLSEFRAKIGDFGLTKRVKQSHKRKLEAYWRGTPMYLSPEAVIDNVQEAPCDIWAFGCIVLEMLTGKPPWGEKKSEEILGKIGEGKELPKIPNGISKEAKDFLKGCFVRKSMYRLTAEMLLHHPFVEGLDSCDDKVDEVEEVEDLDEFEWVCESDDEFSGGSFSYWPDEDGEDVEDEIVSGFEVGNVERVAGLEAGLDGSNDGSRRVKSRVSLESRQHCPVSVGIHAGIW